VVRAVDDVSFSIPSGQTLGLVGSRGVGRPRSAVVSCSSDNRQLVRSSSRDSSSRP
jgi:ABC-type dipeptide/oligopeptide/nickel transport system ATPase component